MLVSPGICQVLLFLLSVEIAETSHNPQLSSFKSLGKILLRVEPSLLELHQFPLASALLQSVGSDRR